MSPLGQHFSGIKRLWRCLSPWKKIALLCGASVSLAGYAIHISLNQTESFRLPQSRLAVCTQNVSSIIAGTEPTVSRHKIENAAKFMKSTLTASNEAFEGQVLTEELLVSKIEASAVCNTAVLMRNVGPMSAVPRCWLEDERV